VQALEYASHGTAAFPTATDASSDASTYLPTFYCTLTW